MVETIKKGAKIIWVCTFLLALMQVGSGQEKPGTQMSNDVVTGIAVSPQGDSYLVGYSKGADSGYDFLTLKYSGSGELEWSRRYDGGGKLDDKPTAIALDLSGNAYVTGSSSAASTGSDYLTLKYSPTGQLLWQKKFNGAGNGFDKATSIAVNPKGLVLVTGFSLGAGKDYDAVTVEYDDSGNEIWSRSYGGESKGDDFGNAVSFGSDGSAYVAGYSQTDKQTASYFLIKYSPKGDPAWVKVYNNSRIKNAKATSLSVSPSGVASISGTVTGEHGAPNILTVAYDPSGKQLWSHLFTGNSDMGGKSEGMSHGSQEDLILYGSIIGESGSDFLTLKIDGGGKTLWANRYNGEGDGDDVATAAKSLPDGSVVVTGYSLGTTGGSDFVTLKYAAEGSKIWAQRYNGAANDVDRPAGLGLDATGAVYVAGSSWGGKQNGFDFVLVKYSADGHLAWSKRYDGSQGGLADR